VLAVAAGRVAEAGPGSSQNTSVATTSTSPAAPACAQRSRRSAWRR